MLPNLHRLRAFQQVYESGTIRDAARALSVTQSALSQQLSKLESELGSQLFVRLHKKLVATPASHALARTVGRFLREIDDDIEALRHRQQTPAGCLRLGAPREFGARQLPTLIASFRRDHPDVSFELTLGHPDRLLPRVENGQLDFAFTDVFESDHAQRRPPSLALKKIADETLILVGSGRYARSVLGGDHGFERVSRATFIGYSPRAEAVRHWFRHHFRRAPSPLTIALSVQSVPAVVTAVKSDVGLGVVPAGHVAAELRSRRLVEISTGKRRIGNQISVAQLQDKRPSAAERAFVRFVCSEAGRAG